MQVAFQSQKYESFMDFCAVLHAASLNRCISAFQTDVVLHLLLSWQDEAGQQKYSLSPGPFNDPVSRTLVIHRVKLSRCLHELARGHLLEQSENPPPMQSDMIARVGLLKLTQGSESGRSRRSVTTWTTVLEVGASSARTTGFISEGVCNPRFDWRRQD